MDVRVGASDRERERWEKLGGVHWEDYIITNITELCISLKST